MNRWKHENKTRWNRKRIEIVFQNDLLHLLTITTVSLLILFYYCFYFYYCLINSFFSVTDIFHLVLILSRFWFQLFDPRFDSILNFLGTNTIINQKERDKIFPFFRSQLLFLYLIISLFLIISTICVCVGLLSKVAQKISNQVRERKELIEGTEILVTVRKFILLLWCIDFAYFNRIFYYYWHTHIDIHTF